MFGEIRDRVYYSQKSCATRTVISLLDSSKQLKDILLAIRVPSG